MNLDWRTVRTLLANELRLLLRSPRTLAVSVVLPLLLWPVMLFLSNLATERQKTRAESQIYRFALTGEEVEVAAARQWLDIAKESPTYNFEEVALAEIAAAGGDLDAAVEDGTLDFYLEALGPEQALRVLAEESTDVQGDAEGDVAESAAAAPVPARMIRFHVRGDRDASSRGSARLRDALVAVREELRMEQLKKRDFPISHDQVLATVSVDVASASQASGVKLGRFLTAVLVLFLLSGGSVVAVDSLAGEKERGTLETLLTTAASHTDIVVAKNLSILLVGVFITVVQVGNLLLWIGLDLLPMPEGFTIPITLSLALLLLVLFLPLAAVVSSALLILSGRARTYKEAQLFFFPLFVVCATPALAPLLPGLELRSAVAVVPIANLAVAVKEVLAGTFDWPFVLLAWITNAALAAYLLRLSGRTLASERLVTAAELDQADLLGGPPLFSRHVLRWFAVLWSVFLVWQLNVDPSTDLRMIVGINMAAMALTSFYLVRRYRLGAAQALALRPAHPAAFVAVLLGAPAGLFVGSWVARLSNLIFEIPDELIEKFSQQIFPEEISTPELLFWIALLPGICEELAFRGVLLYGLRRRLGPLATALATGAVFGLFHVALYRLLPTAFLGVVLATVTLLSGSILPAMLWHALSNGTAVVIDRYGAGATEPGLHVHVLAGLAFAAALALLWRFRRPYSK